MPAGVDATAAQHARPLPEGCQTLKSCTPELKAVTATTEKAGKW